MTRRLLAVTMALGLLVTAMGSAGIYAVFTDQATTGTTGGNSAALPGPADIEIARALSAVDCLDGDYADNLVGSLVQWSDAKPGDTLSTHWFCIRNVGAAAVNVSLRPLDLVSVDIACTGDEAAAGDDTCGDDGQGELQGRLRMDMLQYDCATGSPVGTPGTDYLGALTDIGMPLTADGSIAPGGRVCVRFVVSYPQATQEPGLTFDQRAQSDSVSWRFAFDATEAS